MLQTIEHADRHASAHRPAEPDARRWVSALAPYREPSLGRSLAELVVTVVPFVALWLLMLASHFRYCLCSSPAGGGLPRAPVHDPARLRARLVLPPAARQRLARPDAGCADAHALRLLAAHHAMHHATSGHLGRRGTGDVDTLTVREYQSLPAWRRALSSEASSRSWCSASGRSTCSCSAPPAGAADARGLATLAQRHVDQPRHRGGDRSPGGSRGGARFPAGAGADHPAGPASGCSTSSTSSSTPGGRGTRTGTSTPAPCTAARITICRRCCWFTANIGIHHVHHLSIRSPATGSARRCATIRSCAGSVRLTLGELPVRLAVGRGQAAIQGGVP